MYNRRETGGFSYFSAPGILIGQNPIRRPVPNPVPVPVTLGFAGRMVVERVFLSAVEADAFLSLQLPVPHPLLGYTMVVERVFLPTYLPTYYHQPYGHNNPVVPVPAYLVQGGAIHQDVAQANMVANVVEHQAAQNNQIAEPPLPKLVICGRQILPRGSITPEDTAGILQGSPIVFGQFGAEDVPPIAEPLPDPIVFGRLGQPGAERVPMGAEGTEVHSRELSREEEEVHSRGSLQIFDSSNDSVPMVRPIIDQPVTECTDQEGGAEGTQAPSVVPQKKYLNRAERKKLKKLRINSRPKPSQAPHSHIAQSSQAQNEQSSVVASLDRPDNESQEAGAEGTQAPVDADPLTETDTEVSSAKAESDESQEVHDLQNQSRTKGKDISVAPPKSLKSNMELSENQASTSGNHFSLAQSSQAQNEPSSVVATSLDRPDNESQEAGAEGTQAPSVDVVPLGTLRNPLTETNEVSSGKDINVAPSKSLKSNMELSKNQSESQADTEVSSSKAESDESQEVHDLQNQSRTKGKDSSVAPSKSLKSNMELSENQSEKQSTGLQLHSLFEWKDCSSDLAEVSKFLRQNFYDENTAYIPCHEVRSLEWSMKPPGALSLLLGVKSKVKEELLGFVSAISSHIWKEDEDMMFPVCTIRLLCVKKQMRKKTGSFNLGSCMIAEVKRRFQSIGTSFAVYSADQIPSFPKPLNSYYSYFRIINHKRLKLKEQKAEEMAIEVKTRTPGLRKMHQGDVAAVSKLLQGYLKRFKLSTYMTDVEVTHWIVPRKDVVNTYVVESPQRHCITDFFCFYTEYQSFASNPNAAPLKVATAFYNVTTVTKPEDFMRDILSICKKALFDSFVAFDTLLNTKFLSDPDLGFTKGTEEFHHFLDPLPEPMTLKTDEETLMVIV